MIPINRIGLRIAILAMLTDGFFAVASQAAERVNSRIYFSSADTNGSNSIYYIQTDTSETHRFIRSSVNGRGEVAIDKAKDTVVFGTYRFGGWKLAIGKVDDKQNVSQIRKLTRTDTYKYQPVLSPDTKWVAYKNYYTSAPPRFLNGNDEIYLLNLDTGTERNLSHNPGPDYYPHWSPDQSHILFSSDRKIDGKWGLDLYRVKPDGTDMGYLAGKPDAQEFGASYSKDGKQLAWLQLKNSKLDLVMANADGSSVVNLTEHLPTRAFKGDVDNLDYGYTTSWSPDGHAIAFIGHWEKDRELYLFDLSTQQLDNATNNNVDEFYVNWLPQ